MPFDFSLSIFGCQKSAILSSQLSAVNMDLTFTKEKDHNKGMFSVREPKYYPGLDQLLISDPLMVFKTRYKRLGNIKRFLNNCQSYEEFAEFIVLIAEGKSS
jgi:hypothetical protein